MARAEERRTAVVAADSTCPRCGSVRRAGDRYCLDCGMRLPTVEGRLASLRRRWLRRLGWYPGDWVWLALPALLVAAAGAAVAIVVSDRNRDANAAVFTAPAVVSVVEPGTRTAARLTTIDTTTLPIPPEPGSPTAGGKGRIAWPANANAWTIVLVSYPKQGGQAAALATAAKAVTNSLRQVGILDSGDYSSLQPGYYVVFTGVFATKDEADAAVSTARQAGFAGAYSRQIAR